MNEPNVQEKLARVKVRAFRSSFGERSFHLACHASVPVVLSADLLHLLRVNFFLDPPEPLPYTTESDILLSPLCNEIGDDLYEIPSPIRDILLRELATTHVYGDQRIREVATLLSQYDKHFSPWKGNLSLERGQQLTALNFLDPPSAKRWLEVAEEGFHQSSPNEREWFIAMRDELLKIDATLHGPKDLDSSIQEEINPPGLKLLTSITAHEKPIGRIAWSPDGNKLASPSADTTIKLWDVNTGRLKHTLSGHSSRVICVSWSPMDQYLASGSDDQTARIWDTNSGELIQTIKLRNSSVASLAWSPNGSMLALGFNDSTVLLWRNRGGATQKLAGPTGMVTSVKWSPDGTRLAASSESERRVYVWSIRTNKGRPRLFSHNSEVLDVDWSSDGYLIAASCSDGTIWLWSARDARLIRTLEGHTDIVNAVSFSSDSHLLASKSHDGTVRIWRSDSGDLVSILERQDGHFVVAGLAFNPVKPQLATLRNQDTNIDIWQLDSNELLKSTYEAVDTQLTSAKIILLGEGGVGKTSLAKSLTRADSSADFPLGINRADILTVHLLGGIRCETAVWDMSSSDPLLSRLYLSGADIVLLLFNNRTKEWSLDSIERYRKEVLSGYRGIYRSVWVGIDNDNSSGGITAEEAERFFLKRGREYVLVNVRTGAGLNELIELLNHKISISKLSPTVDLTDFNIIKEHILTLKEQKNEQIYFYGIDEIHESLNSTYGYRRFTIRNLRKSLRHLERHGLIQLLRIFNNQEIVWLEPVYVNQLLESVINDARENVSPPGVIDSQHLMELTYADKQLRHLSQADKETLVQATINLLIDHKICSRGFRNQGDVLVFPALAGKEMIEPKARPPLPLSSFDRLLAWLSLDRESAGNKYEKIRSELINYFRRRGVINSEDLADETIDRVAKRVAELAGTYVGDPARYFYGVARYVYLEHARRNVYSDLESIIDRPLPERPDDLEVEYTCLEECLRKLPQENSSLISQYYSGEGQAKIDNRKKLAEQLGITPHTLRIRVIRIIRSLEVCMRDCISKVK